MTSADFAGYFIKEPFALSIEMFFFTVSESLSLHKLDSALRTKAEVAVESLSHKSSPWCAV